MIAPAIKAMTEDTKPAEEPVGPVPPGPPEPDQGEEVGDFITRNVLDKDSVFFEG